MSAAPPTIPPRPTRAGNNTHAKMPDIPPRPVPKRLESPSRDSFPQSPFNEPYGGSTMARSLSNDNSTASLPLRPPSVSLPSIGQEGSEYADLQYENSSPSSQTTATTTNDTTQTRHIGGNLPMHAPKPSLPSTSAKAQVSAVTRTDSQQAAAYGLGKPATPVEDGEPLTRLKSKSSFSRPGSSSSDRRLSMQYDEEHGPAELGLRVPINPYLGDVQAPSPGPGAEGAAANGTHHHHNHHHHHHRPRQHHRTKSGREVFLPPGSYGLHGHGIPHTDKFEKDWYAKHPDEFKHEGGYYHGIGSGRGESALSSEDLNKLVRQTASRGSGLGTLIALSWCAY